MKHILLLLIVLAALTSCSSSSGSDNPDPTPPADIVEPDVAETTVIVYMPYTGPVDELTSFLQNNLTQMRNVIRAQKGMGNDKVVVFVSTSKQTSHLIQYHYSRLNNVVVSDTLRTFDNSQLDFTSSELIRQIATLAKTAAPANDYAMIIGCHAIGWVHKDKINGVFTRSFGGNGDNNYIMENECLPKGLAAAGIGKLKYLVCDDCYMANIETAYELRSCTHKLIASTCEIMADGLPYTTMFQHLLGTPDYQAIITAFGNFYSQNSNPYGTLSLIDCDQLEAFAQVMKRVNTETAALEASEVSTVQRFDGYNHAVFYDLGDYIAHRCKGNTDLLGQANAALSLLVPYKTNTARYYSATSRGAHDIKAYSGISCSDPSLNGAIQKDKLLTEWWQATH